MPRFPYALALGSTCLVLLAGCTGSGAAQDLVTPSALSAGTCRQAAAAMNTVHREVAGLAKDKTVSADTRTSLANAGTQLQALAAGAPAPVAGKVTDLVAAVGFLRLGIDTHSYGASVLTRADEAAKGLASACRAA